MHWGIVERNVEKNDSRLGKKKVEMCEGVFNDDVRNGMTDDE
jgi:hypothetical protein